MRDPIFVVGTGRSGTTITARCLGLHPALLFVDEPRFIDHLLLAAVEDRLAPEELEAGLACSADGSGKEPMKFLRRLEEHYGERLGAAGLARLRAGTLAACRRFHGELPALSPAARRAALRRTVHRLAVMTRRELGGETWLVKQPDLCCRLEALAAIFPATRFLHVLRQPADVLASRLDGGFQPDFDTAFAVWRERLLHVGRFVRSHPGRVLDVHFEALVARPVETLDAAMRFLGLAPGGHLARAAAGVQAREAHLRRGHGRFDAAQRRRLADACAEIDAAAGGGWLPWAPREVEGAA